MSGWKILGHVIRSGGYGFLKVFYLVRKRKIWIPIHFILGVIPQMLGSYRFLISKGLDWYYALFGAIGAESGGAILTIYSSIIEIFGGNLGLFDSGIIILGSFASLVTLYLIFDIWALSLRGFTRNLGFLPILITLSLFIAATLTNTMFIDEFVLDEDEERVAGLSYFIKNPAQSVQPLVTDDYNATSPNFTFTDLADKTIKDQTNMSGAVNNTSIS